MLFIFFLCFMSLVWCSATRNDWNIFFQLYIWKWNFSAECLPSILPSESWLSLFSLSPFCWFHLYLHISCHNCAGAIPQTYKHMNSHEKTNHFVNSLYLDLSSLSDLPQLTPFLFPIFLAYLFILLLFSLLMRY